MPRFQVSITYLSRGTFVIDDPEIDTLAKAADVAWIKVRMGEQPDTTEWQEPYRLNAPMKQDGEDCFPDRRELREAGKLRRGNALLQDELRLLERVFDYLAKHGGDSDDLDELGLLVSRLKEEVNKDRMSHYRSPYIPSVWHEGEMHQLPHSKVAPLLVSEGYLVWDEWQYDCRLASGKSLQEALSRAKRLAIELREKEWAELEEKIKSTRKGDYIR